MTHEPPRTSQPELVRAIGRWSMVALAAHSILGSGIFGLPSVVAGLVGQASPAAVLIAGAGMAIIIACYAEVASQFAETGGTYLYVRHAFGTFAGLQVGWLMLLSRLTACAAGVNLLVIYLGEFWPAATQPVPRLIVLTVFSGTPPAVDYRGVDLARRGGGHAGQQYDGGGEAAGAGTGVRGRGALPVGPPPSRGAASG